jgi:hypothetical protein
LFAYRRHRFPGIEHVRHLVLGQTLKVLGPEPSPIPHLDSIRPTLWQCPEELIESRDKIPSMLKVGRPEPGELKHEEANLGSDGFARAQKTRPEELGIQEMFVWFAGELTESFQVREIFDCNGVGHFETKTKVVGDLLSHAQQVFLSRKGVISGIDANGFKDFGIFGDAIAVKTRLRELAPILISGTVIKCSEPPGVFPGRGADKHALSGEPRHLLFQLFAVELHEAM